MFVLYINSINICELYGDNSSSYIFRKSTVSINFTYQGFIPYLHVTYSCFPLSCSLHFTSHENGLHVNEVLEY